MISTPVVKCSKQFKMQFNHVFNNNKYPRLQCPVILNKHQFPSNSSNDVTWLHVSAWILDIDILRQNIFITKTNLRFNPPLMLGLVVKVTDYKLHGVSVLCYAPQVLHLRQRQNGKS